MPELVGVPMHTVMDVRTAAGTTNDVIDIPSSEWLRAMAFAKCTEGKLFESGFPVDNISDTTLRLGSSDSRNDIAVIDHTDQYPVPAFLTARHQMSVGSKPLSGFTTYNLAIVLRMEGITRNYANIWTGVKGTDDGVLNSYAGHIILYECDIHSGVGTPMTIRNVAPVSTTRASFV